MKELGKKTIQQEIRHEKGTPQENEFKEQNGREQFCPSQELQPQKDWNLKEHRPISTQTGDPTVSRRYLNTHDDQRIYLWSFTYLVLY